MAGRLEHPWRSTLIGFTDALGHCELLAAVLDGLRHPPDTWLPTV